MVQGHYPRSPSYALAPLSSRPVRGNEPNDAERPSGEQSKKPRVLIVDDVTDNLDLYAEHFEAAGFEVDRATDGLEALARIEEGPAPDAVVMDLAMPVVDGWEATRRIRLHPDAHGAVVVVVTGHATALGLERARDAGADAICTKPCLPSDLVTLVVEHLDTKAKSTRSDD